MNKIKKQKPRILLTNDDGVYAPGIKHLWHFLSSFADVTVIAPATEQSSVGLSITLRHPLHKEKLMWHESKEAPIWSISGTPADCVKLALSVILDNPPDIVVSGINRGGNEGRNVLYSGTVAAIIEGIMHDVPGIAFSAADFTDIHYEAFEPYVNPLISYVLNYPLPKGTFLNVNFPKTMCGPIKGVRLCEQGKGYWKENPEQRTHPIEEKTYIWLGAELATFPEHENSDIALLKQGWVTATPITITDLTHREFLHSQRKIFEDHFKTS